METTTPINRKNIPLIVSIATAGLIGLIFLLSATWFISAYPEKRQLQKCHEAMNFIRDVISYEADVTTRGTDLISQCDPSFKE